MTVRDPDIHALGQILNERAGLVLQADGDFGLALALRARMQVLGQEHSSQYLVLVTGPTGDEELHRLLPLVTVGKTDFFRDERQFSAIATKVIPERLKLARQEGRPLNIWSAGCATGEEPYSLAIALLEAGALPTEVNLVATDINAEAVFEAKRAVYAWRKLKPVAAERIQKFFLPEGKDAAKVAPHVRSLVRFGVHNLTEPLTALRVGTVDIILCRNVMIYFDTATELKVLQRFYDMLIPGAFLALGYSESLFRLYGELELTEVNGAFLYRKPLPGAPRPEPSLRMMKTPLMLPRLAVDLPVRPRPTPPPQVQPHAKAPAIPPVPRAQPAPPEPPVRAGSAGGVQTGVTRTRILPPEAPHRLERAVELMEQGQFLESLDLLRALTASDQESMVGWTTMGNLLSVLRRFGEAFKAYENALLAEPLFAEARLFMGVAFVECARYQEAQRELARALFLDSTLPLAHYYLGRAAEHAGDHAAARRAYKNCLSLCQSGAKARPYLTHYPDLPKDPEVLGRAAQYALGAVG